MDKLTFKKFCIQFFFSGLIGIFFGTLAFNIMEPKWDILWKLNYNKELNGYNLENYENINFQGFVDKEIKTFNIENKNFNYLKNIKITNLYLRYNSSNKDESYKNSQIYIENLNEYLNISLRKKLDSIIKFRINKLEKDYEILLSSLEDIRLSLALKNGKSKNNILIDAYVLTSLHKNITNFNHFDIVNSDSINLDEHLSYLKNSVIKKNLINKNKSVLSIQHYVDLIGSNTEFLKLGVIDSSINRKPNLLLIIITFTIFIFVIIYTLINFWKILRSKNFYKKFKFF